MIFARSSFSVKYSKTSSCCVLALFCTRDMALTLQELKKHLWNCAEILRGSAVDRTDWKAYILPLLFFKRICDVWDEETVEAMQLFGDVDPVEIGRASCRERV